MPLSAASLVCALLAAFLVGFSKAGVPGTGILVVPLMAQAFGGHVAIGATVPLLLIGDVISVSLYRTNCDWSRVRAIAPTVIVGLLLGVVFLKLMPNPQGGKDPANRVIGALVLLMLALQFLRQRLKDRLVPTSSTGAALIGAIAGFSTMVSNAAGPVMSIYLAASNLNKNRFLGTAAWYFLIFNTCKLPFLFWLSAEDPAHPFLSWSVLSGDVYLIPGVLVGACAGRICLPVLSDSSFTRIVLLLAALAAFKLLLG